MIVVKPPRFRRRTFSCICFSAESRNDDSLSFFPALKFSYLHSTYEERERQRAQEKQTALFFSPPPSKYQLNPHLYLLPLFYLLVFPLFRFPLFLSLFLLSSPHLALFLHFPFFSAFSFSLPLPRFTALNPPICSLLLLSSNRPVSALFFPHFLLYTFLLLRLFLFFSSLLSAPLSFYFFPPTYLISSHFLLFFSPLSVLVSTFAFLPPTFPLLQLCLPSISFLFSTFSSSLALSLFFGLSPHFPFASLPLFLCSSSHSPPFLPLSVLTFRQSPFVPPSPIFGFSPAFCFPDPVSENPSCAAGKGRISSRAPDATRDRTRNGRGI